MRRSIVALIGPLVACGPELQFDEVEINVANNCQRAEVVVTYEDLSDPRWPWTQVLAAAPDAPGQRSMWALVEHAANTGLEVSLWHVTDEEIDQRTRFAAHTYRASDEPLLTLTPDAQPGVAWMTYSQGPTFLVAKAERGTNELVESTDQGGFPEDVPMEVKCDADADGMTEPCVPTGWPKTLAMLEGKPHVVAFATSSPSSTTTMFLRQLSPALEKARDTTVQFTLQCSVQDPLDVQAACEDRVARLSYPQVKLAGTQLDPSTPSWSAFTLRQPALEGIPEPWEPVLVTLALDETGSASNNTSQHRAEVGPWAEALRATPDAPTSLAIDEFATYILHQTTDGPRLARISNLDPQTSRFETLEGLEIAGTSRLIQLEKDVAVSTIDDRIWRITKLFSDNPSRSETTEYDAGSTILSIKPAGPGSFLITTADGGPSLVSVACAAP